MNSMDSPTHETDVHDLSLGAIHALRMVDTEALSYVQLRRLYAALVEAASVPFYSLRTTPDGRGT